MKKYSLLGQAFLSLSLTLALIGCKTPESTPSNVPAEDRASMPGMEMSKKSTAAYDWQLDQPQAPYMAGRSITLSWTIRNQASGKPVDAFEKFNTKFSHLVIVSRDLNFFEHIHPDIIGPGRMSVTTILPQEGQYEMFLQFTPKGQEEATVNQPLQIGNVQTPPAQLIPDTDQAKELDGYTFRLSSLPQKANQVAMVQLSIEKDGNPISGIEPYLGAGGHAVIINQDAGSFLHVHPMSTAIDGFYRSPLTFHTSVPAPGLYKMWIQTQIQGKVETVDFTFQVQ